MGPGVGLLFILVTVLISLFTLKAKTTSLADDQDSLKIGIFLNLGIICFGLCLVGISMMVFSGQLNSFIVFQSVINTLIKVVCPAYYISSTPNLYEYFCHVIQVYVFTPLTEFKSKVLQTIDFLIPTPNQIDVIV